MGVARQGWTGDQHVLSYSLLVNPSTADIITLAEDSVLLLDIA